MQYGFRCGGRHGRAAVCIALAVGAWSGEPDAAQAQTSGYTIIKIADTAGAVRPVTAPSINDSGAVAFRAQYGTQGNGLFVSSGGALTTIATTDGPLSGVGDIPSINAAGLVGFQVLFDAGGSGIFTGNGGPIGKVTDNTGPLFSFSSNPVLQKSGAVLFSAFDDNLVAGFYIGSAGGAVTKLADTSGVLSNIFTGYDINDSGIIVFNGRLDTGPSGIFTLNASGGSVTTVLDNAGTFSSLNVYAVNNVGTILFEGPIRGSGRSGLFTIQNGVVTPVATTGDSFRFTGFNAASINDAGDIAFLATTASPAAGMYIWRNGVITPIISAPEPLFGGSLTGFNFSTSGINTAGQIAFYYGLSDGRSGVALATPIAADAPEPTSLLLLTAMMTGWGIGITRRRRMINPLREQ